LSLIVTAAKAMEAPRGQSCAGQNEYPAVRFGIHPDLKDIHEPAGGERTGDSKQYIGAGTERMRSCKTSAEKANYNPSINGYPSSRALTCVL
jgi:hypothetical protein